jgi:uncharacterized membrane protein
MKLKFIMLQKVVLVLIIFSLISSGFGLIPSHGSTGDSETSSGIDSRATRDFEYDQDIMVDDIAVNEYFIVPGIYASKHYPGQSVGITTKFWNLGGQSITTPFEVLMVILDDPNESDVHYEIHMKQTINNMALNSSVNLTWTWTPPAEAPESASWDYVSGGGHTFKARVISLFDGDQNSSNNFNYSYIDIDEPKFAPRITNTIWGAWEVTETPLKQTIPIGSILTLNFTVNNTSSQEDFVKIVADDLPTDWVVLPGTLPSFLQLKGNTGEEVTLRIQISRNNSLALKAIDYHINLRAYSLFSPPKNHTFQFTINLEYSPLARFIMPKDITLTPGSHLIDVTLMNIGNGRDIFTTTTEVFPPSPEWHSTVYSGVQTRLLKTFETTSVTLQVDVPPKRKDSYKTIIVKAHSVQNPTYNTDDEYKFKIYVGQFHDVDLKLSDDVPSPIQMSPAGEYSFELILTNSGNTKDATITLNVSDYPENWKVFLDTSNIPKSGLGRGGDVDVGVLINTPTHTLLGDYTITLTGMAGNPLLPYNDLVIHVKIIEVGKIKVEARPGAQKGNIGDIVQYKIFIQNTGNRLDTFDISMVENTYGMYGWGKLSQSSITLDANASYEIVLTVTIPLNASADTNPNTPSILDGYEITVTAKSQNLSHVVKAVKVTTNVNQFYDFDLSADAYIKPVIRSINEPVAFFLRVHNRGNVKDTFEFALDAGQPKWGRLLTRYKSVKPGTVQEIKFEAKAPEDLGVGVYDFTVIVSSQGDIEKFREITLSVFVSSLELSLTKIMVGGSEQSDGKPVNVEGGDTVLVTAQIKNTGTVDYDNETFSNCQVVFFDGKSTIGRENIHYLPTQGIINVSITWNTSVITQEMTLIVNVDPKEDIPFSNRNNLSDDLKVQVQGPGGSTIDKGSSTDFQTYLLPILLIIILLIVQILALMSITRTKRSRLKVGYTDEGEYRPFADVFDPFADKVKLEGETDEEHPYRLAGGEELDKVSITTTDRPMLPPSTHSVKPTKPIIKTKPLPRTAPVKRR